MLDRVLNTPLDKQEPPEFQGKSSLEFQGKTKEEKSLFHINYKTMHMSQIIIPNQEKVAHHREKATTNWFFQFRFMQGKNIWTIWLKKRSAAKKITTKTSSTG